MKSLIKIFFISIAILSTISSCTDGFLSLSPEDKLTNGNYPMTEADAQSALLGAYGQLQAQNGFGTFAGYTAVANMEWTMSGDLYEQDQNTPRVQLELLDLPPNNNYITDLYNALYKGVGQINYVINEVSKMSSDQIDAPQQSLIMAQAKFLRALFYYRLVNYWGGVSLVLNELDAASNLDVPRSPVDSCWMQIETDLRDAAEGLPVSWPSEEAGRATKGSALGYLVKAYLWQKKWEDAVKISEEIMSLNVYDLLPDFRDVFREANGNNKEIVFATQFSSNENGIEGMNLDVRSAPRGFPSKYVGRDAWSNFVPRREWVHAFETDANEKIRDQRYWEVVIGPGEHHQDMPDFVMPTTYPNQGTKTGYILTKWWQRASPTNVGVDFPLLRYAEVLLNYAEALNEVGRSKEAMKQVNRVRKRAGLEPKPLTLSKEKVLKAILYEARMGFIWEPYGAFSTLNRRGLFLDFIEKHNVEYSKMNVKDKPWLHTQPIRLPIPLAAWNNNKALVQNPGYPPFK